LHAGEAVIIIATEAHRHSLEARLKAAGIDVPAARAVDAYISLDAAETLSSFMVDDWPDEERFKQTVSALLSRAGAHGRRVRAFGEMVALLWAQGHCGATVRLEYLWNRFCEQEGFSLLCAYPKSGFTADAADSIRQICDAHSHVADREGTRTRSESSFKELRKRLNPSA
jgi:KaiC/GvpD/RAD55 family RecA-like ATPase